MIEHKTDHAIETERSIPLFSRKSPEFVNWCKGPAERAQMFEDVALALFDDKNLDSEYLPQLKLIGKHLREPHNNRSIPGYQAALKSKWSKQKSFGTPEQLMDLCDSLFGDSITVWQGKEYTKELTNLLLVTVPQRPDHEKTERISKELKSAKRGGQGVETIIFEFDNIYLIPEEGATNYNLIPETDEEAENVSFPYLIEEV